MVPSVLYHKKSLMETISKKVFALFVNFRYDISE